MARFEGYVGKGFRTIIEALWNRIGELRDFAGVAGEVARDSERGRTISDYRYY
jgi:hypothetical protein